MLISWDVNRVYDNLYLQIYMREYILLRNEEILYRYETIQIGWGLSELWFVTRLPPMVQHMRAEMGYRILAYLEVVFVAPSTVGT